MPFPLIFFWSFLQSNPWFQSPCQAVNKKWKDGEVKQLFHKKMQLYIFCQDTICQFLDLGKMEEGISESLWCKFQRCFCSSHCSLFMFSPDRAFSITLWQFFGVEYRCRQVLMHSGLLGTSFGHCTTSECALCYFSLPAEPVSSLILEMCSVCFVCQWPDTAHLCVSLSFLQFCFWCCCTFKKAKRLKQVNSSWDR